MLEEQDVISGQPSPREHFYSEEVDSGQNRHMRSNETFPGCILRVLGSELGHDAEEHCLPSDPKPCDRDQL